MRSESTTLGDSSSATLSSAKVSPEIEVRDLEMSYGSYVVMRDINFTAEEGQVLVIMGGSGCGKSTLRKYIVGWNVMIGVKEVTHGDVRYNGKSFVRASPEEREQVQHTFGVLYQAGALWSSRTLA